MSRRVSFALLALPAILLASASASASVSASASAAPSASKKFTEHRVPFGRFHLYARDYAGTGPAIVLMHGFPDSLHLYDRLVPALRGRRVITFDFLGWGDSDKPPVHEYTFAEQEAELDAIVRGLKLDKVVPVAHDASGPAAVNWSLAHRDRVAALILLNTFYGVTPTVRAPEAIRIFSEPEFKSLADGIVGDPVASKFLFYWQVGRFISNARVRKELLGTLWKQFYPAAAPGFVGLNRDLLPALAADTARAGALRGFDRPVRIVFGDRDPYLNAGVASSLHELLPTSDLFLLPARHYVQVDAPRRVAELIKSVPLAG